MKNLFKKEDEGYPEVVTAIHKEFNSAGDKLYNEAKQIIDSIRILNEDKVVRLKKLGFTASKEVVEAEQVLSKRKMTEERLKDVEYYRANYPLYKFITEDQVKQICKKYGLIYHKISAYTGFVPEAKLKLMEAFGLRERDARYLYYGSWNAHPMSSTFEEYKKGNGSVAPDKEFMIVAPAKDFNISSREEIRDFTVVAKPIPDPVVLAPVRNGYLVVAAWGAEASDPIVVNDKSN